MRVTAYCRVSTNSDEQENSLANQKYYFKHKIEEEGYKYVPLYYDEGISGTTLKKRDGFNKMLSDAGVDLVIGQTATGEKVTEYKVNHKKKPKFDEIWIKNTSRFARNVVSAEIINKLREKHVYINFLEENINTRDTTKDQMLAFRQVFDQEESKSKSSKVIQGFKSKAMQGKIITNGLLYGYDYIPKPEERLVINPAESEIVKRIFTEYIDGKGLRQIVNGLNADGIRTRKGNEWHNSTVKRILGNEKYYGCNNSLKYDSGIVFSKHYAKSKEKYGTEISDKIEPIITKEMFDKCQEIMQSRRTNDGNKKGVYHGTSKYAGLLFCGKCDKPYNRNVDDGRPFYNCSTKKAKGTKFCDNVNVTEKEIDKYLQWVFEKGFKKIIANDVYNLVMITRYALLECLRAYNNQDSTKAEELRYKINMAKTELKRYYELYAKGGDNVLNDLIDTKKAEIEELTKELEDAERDNNDIVNEADTLARIICDMFYIDEDNLQVDTVQSLNEIQLNENNYRFYLKKVLVYDSLPEREKEFVADNIMYKVEKKDIWLVGKSKFGYETQYYTSSFFKEKKGKLFFPTKEEEKKIYIQNMDIFKTVTNENLILDCKVIDAALEDILPILTNQ